MNQTAEETWRLGIKLLNAKYESEAKRRAVAKIGWNVLLKDEKLVWTYQKPYDILLKPKYRSDLRRRRDSNPRELSLARFPSA